MKKLIVKAIKNTDCKMYKAFNANAIKALKGDSALYELAHMNMQTQFCRKYWAHHTTIEITKTFRWRMLRFSNLRVKFKLYGFEGILKSLKRFNNGYLIEAKGYMCNKTHYTRAKNRKELIEQIEKVYRLARLDFKKRMRNGGYND